MEQLQKIGLLISFMLIICIKGYSQDTTKTIKKIYKIPQGTGAPVSDTKAQRVGAKAKDVYSCDIDKVNKKINVSYLEKDGTITKETYELIEDKK